MNLTCRAKYLAIGLFVAAAGWSANSQTADPPSNASLAPQLVNTCLITNNVDRLVQFYESVLTLKAQRPAKDYAEFHTGAAVLAIFSASAQQKYIPGSARAANNKSAILEFRVTDVDQEYTRLHDLVKTWVKPPTTQPWGTRSVYFRDPDGNMVDFFTPPKPQ